MPVLKKTSITGCVEAVLINRDATTGLSSERVDKVNADYGGFQGDAHYGVTRASCVRVRQQYAEGTEIRNTRQVSILSVEEMQQIAGAMNIPALLPEWVGANMSLSGIPQLSQLPPSSRLIFAEGASLVVDMENGPCKYPGDVIEQYHPGHGVRFASAAINRRGVTAWVEREGVIKQGERVVLHIPPQRIYSL